MYNPSTTYHKSVGLTELDTWIGNPNYARRPRKYDWAKWKLCWGVV